MLPVLCALLACALIPNPFPDRPWLPCCCCVTVNTQALPKLAASNAQVAILGTGKAKYESMVKTMGQKNPKFKGVVKFSAPLAHMITAGADFILVPSRYELLNGLHVTRVVGRRRSGMLYLQVGWESHTHN